MRPNIYLYNDKSATDETVWNLRPQTLTDYNGLFIGLEGSGFETKMSYTRVDNDFVLTEEDPQQTKITGTMYFRTATAIQSFGDFCGNFDGEMKLYYDPEGQYGTDSLNLIWYKTVRLTKFENAELDNKTACFKVKVEFTPDSAMWKRDAEVDAAADVTGQAADIHLYEALKYKNGSLENADGEDDLDAEAYFFDLVKHSDDTLDGVFFYSEGQTLEAVVRNDGNKTGCRIEISNGNAQAITWIEWTCTAEDGTKQYARFDVNIPNGSTLVVDSNALTQCAEIDGYDCQQSQYPAPTYINFIQLYNGVNTIIFDANVIEGVNVKIYYSEQTRAL